ncbi:MAG: M42 family metallopeptidase [Candidatus Sumerlaeia bacterium]
MNKDSEKFLENLLNAASPSGYEQAASKIFRERVKDAADEVIPDVHGNTLAVLNPDAEFKFMLAGHIDEIGLIITHIDDKGFLWVLPVGGVDANHLLGQRVRILTARGEQLGVIGRKPIHLMKPEERKKGVEMEKLWVDIGAKDKKDAEKVVAIGDVMVIDVAYRKLRGNRIIARGCDDRAGAFVVAEVIRNLSKKKLNISVIGVATVQEEIGLRGAITSSYTVKPDAGIAIDVGFAMDHPESEPKKMGDTKIEGGPILHRGPNINPVLGADLEKKAVTLKMPYQMVAEPRGTGTDANAIQLARGGVAAGLVGIPNRYMHSPVEMISLKDLDNIIKLLTEFLASHPAKKDYRP